MERTLQAISSAKMVTPEIVDRDLLASFPSSVAQTLREIWNDRITIEYGWDGVLVGYAIDPSCPVEDLQQALQLVEASLLPWQDHAAMDMELARLRLSTKSRVEHDDDTTLRFLVFKEMLAEYPPDVGLAALRFAANTDKFWPAVAEVRETLDRLVRKRRLLLMALRASVLP